MEEALTQALMILSSEPLHNRRTSMKMCCEKISATAVIEYQRSLSSAKTAGNTWDVNVRKDEQPIEDIKLISEYYKKKSKKEITHERFKKIREEAADFFSHCEKRPSMITFRMCAKEFDDMCAICREKCSTRRAMKGDIEWLPTSRCKHWDGCSGERTTATCKARVDSENR